MFLFTQCLFYFLVKMLKNKSLLDEEGNPIDNGAYPLDIDAEGRVVILTRGEPID